MVAVVPQKINLWFSYVIGIFVFITLACSAASSMVNSLDTVKVLNGSSSRLSSGHSQASANITALAATRLEKTSYKCKGKPESECESEHHEVEKSSNRSSTTAVGKLRKAEPKLRKRKVRKTIKTSSDKFSGRSSVSLSNSDYLPVNYGPYGYQEDVSEARGWITVPLFIIFSIIQFKLVSAIFLAFFGPMILFLLIVQGFLFKATLVMLGLMMT